MSTKEGSGRKYGTNHPRYLEKNPEGRVPRICNHCAWMTVSTLLIPICSRCRKRIRYE